MTYRLDEAEAHLAALMRKLATYTQVYHIICYCIKPTNMSTNMCLHTGNYTHTNIPIYQYTNISIKPNLLTNMYQTQPLYCLYIHIYTGHCR
jgi:hypothetical protein